MRIVRPLVAVAVVVAALAIPTAISRPEPASAYTTIVYDGAGPSVPRIGLIGDSTLAATRWYGILGSLTRYNFVLDAESCRRTTHTSCRGREGYAPENTLTVMRRLEGRWGRVLVLMTKVFLVIFFFMLVRWSWPRFRFDQLMTLAWKVMLPLTLLNLAVTGGVVLATQG